MLKMPYRKRKATSGFDKYCKPQLRRIKSARSAGSRSKNAKDYQKCLMRRGIDTGLGKAPSKKNNKLKPKHK